MNEIRESDLLDKSKGKNRYPWIYSVVSIISVALLIIAFALPAIHELLYGKPTVFSEKLYRDGKWLPVSHPYPHFAIELYSKDWTASLSDYHRYITIEVVHRMIPSAQVDQGSQISIPVSRLCNNSWVEKGTEDHRIVLCPTDAPYSPLDTVDQLDLSNFPNWQLFELRGSFGEEKYSFIQIRIKRCQGSNCANPWEEMRWYKAGISARLSVPSLLPDWRNSGTLRLGRMKHHVLRQLPSFDEAMREPESSVAVDVFFRLNLAEVRRNEVQNLLAKSNPHSEFARKNKGYSWLELGDTDTDRGRFRNSKPDLLKITMRLDPMYIRSQSVDYASLHKLIAGIGGGWSSIVSVAVIFITAFRSCSTVCGADAADGAAQPLKKTRGLSGLSIVSGSSSEGLYSDSE